MVKKSTQKVYWDNQYRLTEYPKFLYEVTLYKIWSDRVESCDNQFYVSDSPLTIKKETTVKKVDDYKLVKFVTWLGAPLDYMLNNGFILYDESNRKPRSSKSGTIQRGRKGRKG